MSKLILEIQMSIDGYIADENMRSDWMIWNWGADWTWDKKLRDYHSNLNKSAGTILISSQMAQEGFNAHWQQATQDPQDPRFDFARHIVATKKVVASKKLTKDIAIPGGWDNTSIMNGPIESEIPRLNNLNKGNVIVYGGATLVSSLIDADLIDEYHLFINPVALGKGLPIFNKRTNLKLLNAAPFDCGVVVCHYSK